MKRVLLSTMAALLIASCGKKEESTTVEVKPTTPTEFVPNSEGMLTAFQVNSWVDASRILRELTPAAVDSLSTEDSATYRQHYQTYLEQRDSACAVAGLIGGHKEYQWITKNMLNTINAPLLDSLGFEK